MYAKMALDKANIAQMARFFALVGTPVDGALLWHCAQGTDRTGIVSALLLEVLGASRTDIIDNYVSCYAHDVDHNPQSHLLAAYRAIEREWGSVDAYIEHALGVTNHMRAMLRKRFIN